MVIRPRQQLSPRRPVAAVYDRRKRTARPTFEDPRQNKRLRGMLLTELVIAMAVLAIAFLPLSYAAGSTAKRFRASYERAVAA